MIPDNDSLKDIHLIDERDGTEIDKVDTARFINEYFTNIGPSLASNLNIPWTYDGENVLEQIPDIVTTSNEIEKLCRDIQIYKSSSVPHLSTKLLKDAFCILTHQLTFILNKIFTTAMIPNSWKSAKVTPLYKGGDRTNVSNYRPISVLPLPGKIMEKIIHDRLSSFLERNEILTPYQDGFRKSRSTIDTIAGFTDDIASHVNQGNCTTASFIDFKKAFDTVSHEILLLKLDRIGVRNRVHTLIQNYLTDRSQYTTANQIQSNNLGITCGVPQGSILGPLLFLIYINDICHCLNNAKVRLYADDTVIYCSGEQIVENGNKLQQSLNSLYGWCNRNKLTININKTKVMTFGSRKFIKQHISPALKIGDTPLENVSTFKYLGVILDRELKFNSHAQNIYKLATYKINTLRRVRPYINEHTALMIYKMKILPYLDYGDIFYMSANEEHLDEIRKLQYRALRICLKANIRTPRVELLNRANIPLLSYRRIAHLRNYMFKRKRVEDYLDKSDIKTRAHAAPLFIIPKSDTKTLDRSILVKGGKEWNSLTVQTRNIKSYDSFKLTQKRWLWDKIPN